MYHTYLFTICFLNLRLLYFFCFFFGLVENSHISKGVEIEEELNKN